MLHFIFEVASYKTLAPDQDVLAAFNAATDPIFRRIRSNTEKSFTLAQTRDLLLPKLMSGELRVRDAEALVAEVV